MRRARTRSAPPGRARRSLRLGLLAVAAVWVVLPSPARAADQPAQPATVSIKGQLPAESTDVADAAAFALDGASTKTQIDYVVAATADARQSFVDGSSDYVISGVPFTAAQQQALEASGRGLIEAPIQATALQFFGFVPPLSIFPNKCLDPESDCSQSDRSSYTGPMRFTSGVLADLYYERSNVWTLPDLADNLDFDHANQFLFPPLYGPKPLVRSDSDATNYYVDAYLAAVAPDVRQATFAPVDDPAAPAPAPSESWPSYVTPSRQGMDNEVSQIREGLDPSASTISFGGTVTAVAPSYVREAVLLNAAKPEALRVPLFAAQVRNSAGEWVDPTPTAITTAVAAGEGTPLTGAVGAPVPGAYPITWVNKLYAPASGLTADQANGIATFIRWQVGAGRAEAAGLADGQITPAMVATALKAADRIVESNCPGAKGTVYTSADGGPFAPKGGLGVNGPFKLCDGPWEPSPASTDESAAADPGTPSDEVPYDSSYAVDPGYSELSPEVASESTGSNALDAAAGSGSGGSAGAGGGASGSAPDAVRASVQRRMPYPVPGLSLSPLDRAVTLCLGAGAFVALRSLYERRRSTA